MKKVAITGSNGRVGSALANGLKKRKYLLTLLDLPEHDVTNLDALVEVLQNHDAVVHCAWKSVAENFKNRQIDPDDYVMTFNVYESARRNHIPLVVMASSNHANRHDNRNKSGKLTVDIPPIPDSPYGAAKVYMEALGRYYATEHEIGVVCVRIGNLNADDEPKPLSEEDPQRWLSHKDWCGIVEAAIKTEEIPNKFVLMNGVSKSDQQVFDWSNSLGWEPQDGSS